MKTIQRHFFQNFVIGIAVPGLTSAFLFSGCNTTNKSNTDNDGQVFFIGDDIAIAETVYGKVRGFILRGIYQFRGIPYGADTDGETGDFNYTKDSDGYSIMVSTENKMSFYDTKEITQTPFIGRPHGANGFEERVVSKIIDFIFVNEGVKTNKCDILVITKDNVYVSDHYPVFSSLMF